MLTDGETSLKSLGGLVLVSGGSWRNPTEAKLGITALGSSILCKYWLRRPGVRPSLPHTMVSELGNICVDGNPWNLADAYRG